MDYGDMTIQNQAVSAPLPFIGNFTRDISIATGTQSITGIGFRPTSILFNSNVGSNPATSIGFDNGTIGRCVANNHNETANNWQTINASIRFRITSGDVYEGDVLSFDADGFTVDWTKIASPTGIATMQFMAFK